MSNRLEPILARRRQDVVATRNQTPLSVLEAAIAKAPPTRGFRRQLTRPGLQVISEIKRGSPSAGVIRAEAEPAQIAAAYQQGGAACLSVLTEPHYFNGSDEDLLAARAAVALPVLRKDFVVDAYQLAEARALGADCVLLIVAALGQETEPLLDIARDYGLDVLVEIHNRAELDIAIEAGADMIGINNRDLTTFLIDIATSETLLPLIPAGTVTVAESGLETVADFRRMLAAGADAVLVGSALMRADNPGQRLAELLAGTNQPAEAMA